MIPRVFLYYLLAYSFILENEAQVYSNEIYWSKQYSLIPPWLALFAFALLAENHIRITQEHKEYLLICSILHIVFILLAKIFAIFGLDR